MGVEIAVDPAAAVEEDGDREGAGAPGRVDADGDGAGDDAVLHPADGIAHAAELGRGGLEGGTDLGEGEVLEIGDGALDVEGEADAGIEDAGGGLGGPGTERRHGAAIVRWRVMEPMRFRIAVRDDVDALVALVQSAYRGESSRAGWTTEADLLDGQRTDAEEVAALIAAPASRILIAGDFLGSLLVSEEPDAAHLGMFAVKPGLQGRGIGAALLAEGERVAREVLKRRQGRMTVIGQRDALIAWYERRGWRRTGEREPFPYGNPRFGIPRRPDLYFEVLVKPL